MRRSYNETLEDALKNPTYIIIGSGVSLIIVVLFCMIVWNVTHQKEQSVVLNNATNNTVEIPAMGESVTDEIVVTPKPEEIAEMEDSIDRIIAEKSNDQGLVFVEMDDWITAKEVTNLRSEPSTEKGVESVVVKLSNGDPVRRVGINEETGWSKVIYEDMVVYASTAYMVEAEAPVENGNE